MSWRRFGGATWPGNHCLNPRRDGEPARPGRWGWHLPVAYAETFKPAQPASRPASSRVRADLRLRADRSRQREPRSEVSRAALAAPVPGDSGGLLWRRNRTVRRRCRGSGQSPRGRAAGRSHRTVRGRIVSPSRVAMFWPAVAAQTMVEQRSRRRPQTQRFGFPSHHRVRNLKRSGSTLKARRVRATQQSCVWLGGSSSCRRCRVAEQADPSRARLKNAA